MNYFKRLVLLSVLTMALSGCAVNVERDVMVFNENTESTINLYNTIKDTRKPLTNDVIQALADGNIDDIPHSDTCDLQQAVALMSKYRDDAIAPTPNIMVDEFYTRLSYKCVTEVVDFTFQSTRYLMEILWNSNGEIDTLTLEVKDTYVY